MKTEKSEVKVIGHKYISYIRQINDILRCRLFKLSAIRYVVGNFPSLKNLNLLQGENEFSHCSRFNFFIVASETCDALI